MRPLYKTTIVIWADFDTWASDLDVLASHAMTGLAYCSKQESVRVDQPEKDPDWDGTEFFGI